MSLLTQKTLKKNVKLNGVGLHSGNKVNLNIKPSEPNTGIYFKRVDLSSNNIIFPNFSNVSNTDLNTTISNEFGVKVSTIEHLMGALFGLGIDNALIEIDNDEVPILDGSAKDFIDEIIKSGLQTSNAPIKIIKINKKINFEDGERYISIEPSKLSLDIDFQIKYSNELIGNQRNKINVYEDDLNDIFNSRTFCLYEDIEKIKKIGLAKGGSLDNAVVVDENSVLNKEGLRNNQEFVNHKILDLAGDFLLSGHRIIGKVLCNQGGHELTNIFLKKLISQKSAFSIIELQEDLVSEEISSDNSVKIAVNA